MTPLRCIPFVCRIVMVFMCVFSSSQVLASSPQENWRQFRDRYPYHIQTIAISDPDTQGRRTLLITEPPPQITVEDLKVVDVAAPLAALALVAVVLVAVYLVASATAIAVVWFPTVLG